ncbi:MAG: hypothetical protein ACYCZF_17060 [Anaerolineae bacterium]
MTHLQSLVIYNQAAGDPLCDRALAILIDRIQARSTVQITLGVSNPNIVLATEDTLPSEAFSISAEGEAVRIAGGSPQGLLYGIGKFLRTSGYQSGFSPSSWRGTSAPQGVIRGMYYASHFHNWYHNASETEITHYTEDLALWGVNAVMAIFPAINLYGWDDPETTVALEMLRRYARIVRGLGLKFATAVGNTWFRGTPAQLLATPLPDPTGRHGNSGFPICPSNPQGHALIMANARRVYQELAEIGIDLLVHWPYDEGGCACEKCHPWGSNGYYRLSRDLSLLAREYFPGIKTILSTWGFDTPPEGEWEGLARNLAQGNDWLDFIQADAHENFPAYPLQQGVPGSLPLINFPEISMWGLYPWGGFGATVLPRRLQRLWNQVKGIVSGGFPYSEGIYEDLNKAIEAQFYWDRERTAEDTLREYIAYEYSPEVTEDVLRLIGLLEIAHTHRALLDARRNLDRARASGAPAETILETEHVIALIEADLGASAQQPGSGQAAGEEAHRLAVEVDARLPKWAAEGWRWRILYLRTVLERLRSLPEGLKTHPAQAAMRELIGIFHAKLVDDGSDEFHVRVRPPLEG